ncbi:hypothetical protein K7X08_028224 [Anisodus acutangulus]|uniref:Asparagine--tRNA ligase n=1 Tax=Anisodus acutangulus TaxID=402998 RepID=A0A9Q1MV29_9SOLA|nr:hypothetical protein K7X08_028224 [Anisodus acutangulus]
MAKIRLLLLLHYLLFILLSSLALLQGSRNQAIIPQKAYQTFQVAQGALHYEGGGKQWVEKNSRRLMIGSVAPTCTYNECRGCKYKCRAEQVPVEGNDPMNSPYHYKYCSHFRPRTTTVASAMRIHNALTWATHGFFQDQGFLHVQVPIITSTDSEGFSEKFLVTTLLSKGKKDDQISSTEDAGVNFEAIRASIKEKSKKVEELSRTDSNKEALFAAQQDLKKTNELVSQLETRQKAKSGVAVETRKLDFSKDLFAHQTYLTVSGRLHLESQACALGNVYCFGPRFQAEKSESKESLAETWMVDVEMAFSELEDAMDCANDFLKFVCKRMVEGCMEDLQFVLKRIDKAVMERLQFTISSSFERISYAEAIEVLRQVAGKRFHSKIEFGVSLTEEHQSYLVDEIYKNPTVATFNVVLPKVGTVIRGSQSEERFNVLSSRMNELGLQKQQHEWYLDLRRHGSGKTFGFSLMLEPLVLYATGLNDVKDVIPFPRSFRRANS